MVGFGVTVAVIPTYFNAFRIFFQPFDILGKLFNEPLFRSFMISLSVNGFSMVETERALCDFFRSSFPHPAVLDGICGYFCSVNVNVVQIHLFLLKYVFVDICKYPVDIFKHSFIHGNL